MNTRALRAALALLAPLGLLAALCPPAPAFWFNDPVLGMVQVSTTPGSQTYPKLLSLNNQKTFICWSKLEPEIQRAYFQILSPTGVFLLESEGRLIFNGNWNFGCLNPIIPDGDGGCIAILGDDRDGTWDVYGQRIDSLGYRMWGDAGLPLVVWNTNDGATLVNVSYDSMGNIFIAWMCDLGAIQGLYVQKVNLQGQRLWGDYGVLDNGASPNCEYQRTVPDGQGGVLDVWLDTRPGGGGGDPHHFWAQHLDINGNPLWTTNGIQLFDPSTGQDLQASWMTGGVPDGAGGGIFAYSNYWNFFVMRLTGAGQVSWVYRGLQPDTCYTEGILRHPADGNIWVTTRESRGGTWDWFLYLFNLQGEPLFPYGGVPYGGVMTATSDGVITLRRIPQHNHPTLVASRVDSNGMASWTSNFNLRNEGWDYLGITCTLDGADGMVGAWSDSRNWPINNNDIFAQRVQYSGVLGSPSPHTPYVTPEPEELIEAVGPTSLLITLRAPGPVSLKLYDLLGREAARVLHGYQSAGALRINLTKYDLPSGIYLLRLITQTEEQTHKVVIMR